MSVSPLSWFLVSRASLLPDPTAVLLHVPTPQASTALRKGLESHCPLGSACRAVRLALNLLASHFDFGGEPAPSSSGCSPLPRSALHMLTSQGSPGGPPRHGPGAPAAQPEVAAHPLCAVPTSCCGRSVSRGALSLGGPAGRSHGFCSCLSKCLEDPLSRVPFIKPQETTPDFKISVFHFQKSRYRWNLNQERIFPSFGESVISFFPLFPDTHTSGAREELTKEV